MGVTLAASCWSDIASTNNLSNNIPSALTKTKSHPNPNNERTVPQNHIQFQRVLI